MARFELKFIDEYDNNIYTNVNKMKSYDKLDRVIKITPQIEITIETKAKKESVFLDKSTAIKFAKTLRTEINKITESEVSNG